jgi:hypothetical protein
VAGQIEIEVPPATGIEKQGSMLSVKRKAKHVYRIVAIDSPSAAFEFRIANPSNDKPEFVLIEVKDAKQNRRSRSSCLANTV